FFGLEGSHAILKMIRHAKEFHKPYEKLLASERCKWKIGDRLTANVTVAGPKLRCELSNGVKLVAVDKTYPNGKVALVADVPTLYHRVKVTTNVEAKREIDLAISERRRTEADLQSRNPKPVVWRKIKTAD